LQRQERNLSGCDQSRRADGGRPSETPRVTPSVCKGSLLRQQPILAPGMHARYRWHELTDNTTRNALRIPRATLAKSRCTTCAIATRTSSLGIYRRRDDLVHERCGGATHGNDEHRCRDGSWSRRQANGAARADRYATRVDSATRSSVARDECSPARDDGERSDATLVALATASARCNHVHVCVALVMGPDVPARGLRNGVGVSRLRSVGRMARQSICR